MDTALSQTETVDEPGYVVLSARAQFMTRGQPLWDSIGAQNFNTPAKTLNAQRGHTDGNTGTIALCTGNAHVHHKPRHPRGLGTVNRFRVWVIRQLQCLNDSPGCQLSRRGTLRTTPHQPFSKRNEIDQSCKVDSHGLRVLLVLDGVLYCC